MKKVKLTYKKVLAVLFSLVIFAFFISVCERFVRSAILGQDVTANDGASANAEKTGSKTTDWTKDFPFSQDYENSGYIREYDVAAVIDRCEDGFIYGSQRNKFSVGDEVEILSPGQPFDTMTIKEIFNENGESVESACHATMKVKIPCDKNYPKNSVIRMKK